MGEAASSGGSGVHGRADAASGTSYGVYGTSNSSAGRGVAGHALATSGAAHGVLGRTNSPDGFGVYYLGGLGGIGLNTSIVRTAGYDWRNLYAMASPEVLFEDVGTAQLVDGQAVVPVDPIFAQTVDLEQIYQVFLTPMGDCGLYVAEKTPTSFTVRALDGKACRIAFDYRIIAKRLGYEDVRLAVAADPALTPEVAPPSAAPQEQP
jgi:hypothetical protein